MAQKDEKRTGKFSAKEMNVPKELLFRDLPETEKITKPINSTKEPLPLGFEQKTIPLYIVILLIALALVGGFAVFSFLNTPIQPIINQPVINEPAQDDFVKVISIYSSKCNFCEKSSTMILSFQVRSVKMQIENVDIESARGKQLLQLYSITSVPSTLIEEKTIKAQYPEIFASLNGQKIENGYFIVPELYLDKKPHNKMFLETREALGSSKATIQLFLDYDNQGSYSAFQKSEELRQKFGTDLNIVFRNFVLNGQESESIAIASECAKLQGNNKQLDFIERMFFYKYEDQNAMIDLYPSDVLKIGRDISDNNSFSLDDFIECFGSQQTKKIVHAPTQFDADQNIGTDNLAALNTYVIGFAPAIVIDNQFVTYNVAKLEEQICSVRKELAACKQ
ncbi:MAG: hypothetical protein Q7S21_06935 [archaeon]|nr:hypothetical protein [archaeon]